MGDFVDGISEFADLHDALAEICDLPTVILCHGTTRGGGMTFPSVADIVLATPDATFGFSEVRRGVLPGVVSVHAQPHLSNTQCGRFMLTGDAFDASEGASVGFVDHVLPSDEDTGTSLESIVQYLLVVDNLQLYKTITNTTEDLNVALVEMGKDSLPVADSSKFGSEWRAESSIVNGVVAVLFSGTSMTLEAVIELKTLCLQLQ